MFVLYLCPCSCFITHSRHKSYADQRRKPLEFALGDHVFMRVTPTKGVG